MESPIIIIIALLVLSGILIYWKMYQIQTSKKGAAPVAVGLDDDDECILGNCEEAMSLWASPEYSSQGSFMLGSPFQKPLASEDRGATSSNLAKVPEPIIDSQ